MERTSYIPLQFLSRYYNKRTDKYGGSFENRARFWVETIEKVRKRPKTWRGRRFAVDTLLGKDGVEVRRRRNEVRRVCRRSSTCGTVNLCGIAEWGENATLRATTRPVTTCTGQDSSSQVAKKPVLGVAATTIPTRCSKS